jgi:D-serine deaminase-like pyridoxal phosphate-dependent protein
MPLPPAIVGMNLLDVDTPALIIDLDAMERNLVRMAEFAKRAGVRLRPHAKTHKSPDIAARQLALGAVGVCCQKVAEAEVLVEGGITDVLVSNEVVGKAKLARLAALARRAKIGVCVDAAANVAELQAAAAAAGSKINVLVEIDVGAHRCGVAPGVPAAQLAAQVARSEHLRFAGLQAYHGSAQHVRQPSERASLIAQATARVRETQAALQAVGLRADIVAGAGTGTYQHEGASGVYNELQTGSYVFMDADYAANTPDRAALAFEHALFVLSTVMSAPTPDRRVLDAGLKAFAVDSGMPVPWRLDGCIYRRASDEHGVLDVAACAEAPGLGDKVLLVPGHCDPTVNLHDWYVGMRGLSAGAGRVECLWPVAARGALF